MSFWIGLIIGIFIGVIIGISVMAVLICCRLNDEDSHEVKKGGYQNGKDKKL